MNNKTTASLNVSLLAEAVKVGAEIDRRENVKFLIVAIPFLLVFIMAGLLGWFLRVSSAGSCSTRLCPTSVVPQSKIVVC